MSWFLQLILEVFQLIENFSGRILSVGGRFSPKRLAAPTFQLSMADVLPSQTSKGEERMTKPGNSYIADL